VEVVLMLTPQQVVLCMGAEAEAAQKEVLGVNILTAAVVRRLVLDKTVTQELVAPLEVVMGVQWVNQHLQIVAQLEV